MNISLLEETLSYIEDHPKSFSQSAFRCLGRMCFGGHALRLSLEIKHGPKDTHFWSVWKSRWTVSRALDKMDTHDMWTFAQDALGLTSSQAILLFSQGNNIFDLRRIISILAMSSQ